MEDKRFWTEW